MEQQEIEDVQALINIFFPFAEELIVKFGEFYPYAGATTITGEFVSVGFNEGIVRPPSQKVIENLKETLKKDRAKFLVAAIFYEVKTKDTETGASEDAIAVFVEHRDSEKAYEFFYPYNLEGDDFVVGESYGNTIPKEIF